MSPVKSRTHICFYRSCEENILKAYNKINELAGEILSLSGNVYHDSKPDYAEFYVSAKGMALFQALLLAIKKYRLKQAVENLIFGPCTLAQKLEYWFDGYKKQWRARNKESELYRIKEAIMGICGVLRRL